MYSKQFFTSTFFSTKIFVNNQMRCQLRFSLSKISNFRHFNTRYKYFLLYFKNVEISIGCIWLKFLIKDWWTVFWRCRRRTVGRFSSSFTRILECRFTRLCIKVSLALLTVFVAFSDGEYFELFGRVQGVWRSRNILLSDGRPLRE